MCEFTDRLASFFSRLRKGSASSSDPTASSSDRPTARSHPQWVLAHPLLVALAPIVWLYVKNFEDRDTLAMLSLSAAALVMTAGVLAVARLLLGNMVRAACFTSAFNLVFFSYGRVFDLVVAQTGMLLTYRAWHVVLSMLSVAALGAAYWALRRSKRDLWQVSRFLTSALLILLGLMFCQAVPALLSEQSVAVQSTDVAPSQQYERIQPLTAESPQTPDIYYIILDGYARADVLQRVYSFDNAPFLDFLRSRGFYVAEHSCANYPFTYMSLASSLNLRYLDDLLPPVNKSKNRLRFYELLWNPVVSRIMQSKGYRVVHFHTNYMGTQHSDVADIHVCLRPLWMQNEFAQVLLRTTALRIVEPSVAEMHLHAFRQLLEVPKIQGPTFTFAHLIVPHRPFVFDCDGNVKREVVQSLQFRNKGDSWRDLQGYLDQVAFVNKKMREIVDGILADSSVPPIIIIQADHGSAATYPGKGATPEQFDEFALERMPILNAYLVPAKMRQKLYPGISPANTFRILLTQGFGEQFDLLPDEHFIAWYGKPLDLRRVTNVVRPSDSKSDPPVATKPISSSSR